MYQKYYISTTFFHHSIRFGTNFSLRIYSENTASLKPVPRRNELLPPLKRPTAMDVQDALSIRLNMSESSLGKSGDGLGNDGTVFVDGVSFAIQFIIISTCCHALSTGKDTKLNPNKKTFSGKSAKITYFS